MNFFEEAEFGFRKAVEFGDTELDTWLFRGEYFTIPGRI